MDGALEMAMRALLLTIGICAALAGRVAASPIAIAPGEHDKAVVAHEVSKKVACGACHVSTSISKLNWEQCDDHIVVTAQIEVAISNAQGLVTSLVQGRARAISVASGVDMARSDALTAAVDSAARNAK
jgi:hypothetical protein